MSSQEVQRAFEIDRGPFIAAVILFGLGGLVMFIAMALGTKAAVEHSRRFVETMDPSVGDFAKKRWNQVVAAGVAAGQAGLKPGLTPGGSRSWRSTTWPRPPLPAEGL